MYFCRMNFLRNNLANAFTLGNLFSGSIGVISLLNGDYTLAAICIVISLVLDFLDGFVARAMKADSNLGVQLDSLADMVTFGLLPGLTMYKMLENTQGGLISDLFPFLKFFGLFITLFSCLRLAIFNLDDEQKYYFKGLNTPTNTIFIYGLYYAYQEFGAYDYVVLNGAFLLVITALSSWLLISPIRMISLKFKSLQIRDNYSKIALFIGIIALLAIFGITGIPLAVMYYLVVSLVFQKQLK